MWLVDPLQLRISISIWGCQASATSQSRIGSVRIPRREARVYIPVACCRQISLCPILLLIGRILVCESRTTLCIHYRLDLLFTLGDRAIERSSERSSDRANARAIERSSERLCDQAIERSIEQSSDRAIERAIERSSDRGSARATERPNARATERPSDRTTERPSDRATERSSDRATE